MKITRIIQVLNCSGSLGTIPFIKMGSLDGAQIHEESFLAWERMTSFRRCCTWAWCMCFPAKPGRHLEGRRAHDWAMPPGRALSRRPPEVPFDVEFLPYLALRPCDPRARIFFLFFPPALRTGVSLVPRIVPRDGPKVRVQGWSYQEECLPKKLKAL